MAAMTNNERSPHDNASGTPKIPPEIIRLFMNLPNSFEEQFRALREHDPDMARELFIAADNYAHRDLKQKRAFAAGALFMYGLLQYDQQRKYFESLLEAPTNDDDGEVPPPLT
jgi:hypothetical protein